MKNCDKSVESAISNDFFNRQIRFVMVTFHVLFFAFDSNSNKSRMINTENYKLKLWLESSSLYILNANSICTFCINTYTHRE